MEQRNRRRGTERTSIGTNDRPPSMLLRPHLMLALLALSARAGACPVCDSPTGHEVRAGIFDGRFALTWLEVAAPFPVLLGILAILHWSLRD